MHVKFFFGINFIIFSLICMTGCNGQKDVMSTYPQLTNPIQQPSSEQVEKDMLAKLKLKNRLASTVTQKNGKAIVTNPDSILVILNRKRYLPDGYTPSNLVEPNVKFSFNRADEKRQMRKEAARALEAMFLGAKKQGLTVYAVSGYRSFDRQQDLFNYHVKTQCKKEHAACVRATPGTSEHQTGLTMDLSNPSIGDKPDKAFGTSKEGKWVAAHAHEFGFIIRYPKNRENITGYIHEPWHIRYVGKKAAQAIFDGNLTLEEWLQ